MTAVAAAGTGTAKPARIVAVDVARGAALVGMFVYHLCWDLAYFGFVDDGLPFSPALRLLADVVAGSFLLLVGFSLVLATRVRMVWAIYLERLVWIAGAAAAVSLTTWLLFPGNFIFFGILHLILVASVLALPFVGWPAWVSLAAAAAFFVPPFFASSTFDGASLWWLGLGVSPPPTFDYRPVFPWTGLVLAGVALARLVLPRSGAARWTSWRPRGLFSRTLAWGGRHSLLVYLCHQPIFVGLLFLLFQAVGPSHQVEKQPFVRSCERQCRAAGAKPETCQAACGCVVERAKREGLWPKVLANSMSPEETDRFRHFGGECLRAAPPAAPPTP